MTIVYTSLALVLPVTALIGRKLDWRKGAVMALAWAAIFAGVAAFISLIKGWG